MEVKRRTKNITALTEHGEERKLTNWRDLNVKSWGRRRPSLGVGGTRYLYKPAKRQGIVKYKLPRHTMNEAVKFGLELGMSRLT